MGVDQPRSTGGSRALLQRLTAGPGESSKTKANREKTGVDFTAKKTEKQTLPPKTHHCTAHKDTDAQNV